MRSSRHISGNQRWREESPAVDAEMLVGSILFCGVVTSSALLAIGLVWHRLATGDFELDYPLVAKSFAQFVLADIHQLFSSHLQPRALISLGLAILMVTPYLRVLVSIGYFALVERNWKYSLFTSFVFAVLTYSLFHG